MSAKYALCTLRNIPRKLTEVIPILLSKFNISKPVLTSHKAELESIKNDPLSCGHYYSAVRKTWRFGILLRIHGAYLWKKRLSVDEEGDLCMRVIH